MPDSPGLLPVAVAQDIMQFRSTVVNGRFIGSGIHVDLYGQHRTVLILLNQIAKPDGRRIGSAIAEDVRVLNRKEQSRQPSQTDPGYGTVPRGGHGPVGRIHPGNQFLYKHLHEIRIIGVFLVPVGGINKNTNYRRNLLTGNQIVQNLSCVPQVQVFIPVVKVDGSIAK